MSLLKTEKLKLKGNRTHSQVLLEVGPLNSGPVSSPNLPLLIPRPQLPRWRRYQGKWITWRGRQPLTITTLQPAGRAQIGAGSGSNQPPPPRLPHSLNARGSRPWQVPGGGLGCEGGREGREEATGVVSLYPDGLEVGKRVTDIWTLNL